MHSKSLRKRCRELAASILLPEIAQAPIEPPWLKIGVMHESLQKVAFLVLQVRMLPLMESIPLANPIHPYVIGVVLALCLDPLQESREDKCLARLTAKSWEWPSPFA